MCEQTQPQAVISVVKEGGTEGWYALRVLSIPCWSVQWWLTGEVRSGAGVGGEEGKVLHIGFKSSGFTV